MFLFQLKGTYGDPEAQHTFVAAGRMDKTGKVFLDYIPSFSKQQYQYHVVLTMIGSGATKEQFRYKPLFFSFFFFLIFIFGKTKIT